MNDYGHITQLVETAKEYYQEFKDAGHLDRFEVYPNYDERFIEIILHPKDSKIRYIIKCGLKENLGK